MKWIPRLLFLIIYFGGWLLIWPTAWSLWHFRLYPKNWIIGMYDLAVTFFCFRRDCKYEWDFDNNAFYYEVATGENSEFWPYNQLYKYVYPGSKKNGRIVTH